MLCISLILCGSSTFLENNPSVVILEQKSFRFNKPIEPQKSPKYGQKEHVGVTFAPL
jgi:hypothetical protein